MGDPTRPRALNMPASVLHTDSTIMEIILFGYIFTVYKCIVNTVQSAQCTFLQFKSVQCTFLHFKSVQCTFLQYKNVQTNKDFYWSCDKAIALQNLLMSSCINGESFRSLFSFSYKLHIMHCVYWRGKHLGWNLLKDFLSC